MLWLLHREGAGGPGEGVFERVLIFAQIRWLAFLHARTRRGRGARRRLRRARIRPPRAARSWPHYTVVAELLCVVSTSPMGASQSIAELSKEAHKANEAGLYAEARRIFLEIVKLEPHRNTARVSAANMALKAGDAEVALRELNALLARGDMSQACIIVAMRNQKAAAAAVDKARAQRLDDFSPVPPKRLQREASQLSEREPQARNSVESIDHRLTRLAREQEKDAKARTRWRCFLCAAILLVACFAYATQSEILALPSSLQGPVGGSLSTTSGSEPKARGGRGRRQRGGGAAAGPQSARKEAKPMATAAHEIDWRSHLLGLSEHFAIAHFPSEFTQLSSSGQIGLILVIVALLGCCARRSTTRAAGGRGGTKGGATDYANTLAEVVAELSYDSPTPEHLWYHPVRLVPHLCPRTCPV